MRRIAAHFRDKRIGFADREPGAPEESAKLSAMIFYLGRMAPGLQGVAVAGLAAALARQFYTVYSFFHFSTFPDPPPPTGKRAPAGLHTARTPTPF